MFFNKTNITNNYAMNTLKYILKITTIEISALLKLKKKYSIMFNNSRNKSETFSFLLFHLKEKKI